MPSKIYDAFIIGGGINGCGIARDLSGRDLDVVLAEMGDLAQATSSASTKLFHGGLRYLEYYEFRLVREALKEREVLLQAMPHISWPMRFVLPHSGVRPAWLIRLGLFLYDHIGGRKILPATRTINLRTDPLGKPLQKTLTKAFEYSDCWVQDARLVVLNARDAVDHGAKILTRAKVTTAERIDGLWQVKVLYKDEEKTFTARALINAGGPWVDNIVNQVSNLNEKGKIRLVRGSHIITKKLFDHDQPYFFQGKDGRIAFAIPYEEDFTLIGTTDQDHENMDEKPVCSEYEKEYLLSFVSDYLEQKITKEDIISTYSGVRPLYNDGSGNATSATRDYVLKLDENNAPMLNVYGGKITTYRRLAESAFDKLSSYFPNAGPNWTASAHLPGGDFKVDGVYDLISDVVKKYSFVNEKWAKRLVKCYGTEIFDIFGNANTLDDLGINFGAGLTEKEVNWLMQKEFAVTTDDIIWRRTKLGLRMSAEQVKALENWIFSLRGR